MAYRMTSPSQYPFHRENAKFFSQELIEYVLFDFGHVWKPMRSKRETQLRKVASFVFFPPIGRLVAYVSRKYSAFVVTKSFKTWNYINSHRPSVRERLLCNEIVSLCTRHELEDDDLGLFTFLAIVFEFSRLAITSEQEKLVDITVDALSHCLTNKLPGGFVPTLDRIISCTTKFNYPRNSVVCDYDPHTRFLSPVSTEPMYTPKSDYESPIMLEFHFPPSMCNMPPDDIVAELKARKIHRELFRRRMMTDRVIQTENVCGYYVSQLHSVVLRSEQADLAEKIDIKNSIAENSITNAVFMVVETNDVSVQTWSSDFGEQPDISCYSDEAKRKKVQNPTTSKYALDLSDVIEKLKELERLQFKDILPDSSRFDVSNFKIKDSEDGKDKSDVKSLSTTRLTESIVPQSLYLLSEKQSLIHDTYSNPSSESQISEIKGSFKKDTSIDASMDDSQFESLDASTDDPECYPPRKNYSFDSQIGSLDDSMRISDESKLEN